MAKGYKKTKYRVRYDRVVIVVLAMVILAVLITSCTKAVFGKDEPGGTGSDTLLQNTTSTADIAETSSPSESLPSETETASSPVAEDTEKPTEEIIATEPPTMNENYKSEACAYGDIYKGNLILVNADYEYKFPEDDIDPIKLVENRNDYYGAGDYVTRLDKFTLYQLNAMIEAFAEYKGTSDSGIFILDGYRTFEEQYDRHSSGKSKTFEAGHTDYHTGRTFDMFYNDSESGTGYSYFSAEGEYEWFRYNAAEYGFIVRYPEGKEDKTGEKARAYTYRYVGTPHSVFMNENDMCLEEYIEFVKSYNIDNPLSVQAGGRNYSVYYVPVEKSDVNEIYVPKNKIYTVSGNNADGFIVTVIE